MSSPSKCFSPTKSTSSSKTSRSFGEVIDKLNDLNLNVLNFIDCVLLTYLFTGTTSGNKTTGSISNNKLSSDLSSKHSISSSNTNDRKYGLLKKHGTKKHEKKKSSK